MEVSIVSRQLNFIKSAVTSRGSLNSHTAYYIIVKQNGQAGIGEAAPLPGLSIDYPTLQTGIDRINEYIVNGKSILDVPLQEFPSLQFAVQTALFDLYHGGKRQIFNCDFYNKSQPIETNGLVWMSDSETMLKEAFDKVEKKFHTIKFKVGALDFDEECRMLEKFRKYYNSWKVTIRLDANGAFKNDEVFKQFKELKRFDIHSIEQPIQAGQWEQMSELIAHSPIDIAFDEELIGLDVYSIGKQLINLTNVPFIIIKPTLIGSFEKCNEWVKLANQFCKGWWSTSALESNIGLNAIAQWASSHKNPMPQGLGTGLLYHNNIISPLTLENGTILYNFNKNWESLETLEAVEKET